MENQNLLTEESNERIRVLEETGNAVMNILDDFASEKIIYENTQKAVLNILEDYNIEKIVFEDTQKAVLNILDDYGQEKEELIQAKDSLKQLNDELEDRVKIRTDELTKMNIDLRKTNIDLDNFVYTASHDLKSPISNLEGLMDALRGEIGDSVSETGTMILDMINEAIVRFRSTIHELTEITKIQKDANDDIEESQFVVILNEVIAGIELQIKESDAKILHHFNIIKINFSKKNLRSIMYNLVSNAVKYRSPERAPVVEIRTELVGEYILLTVKDNGLGFKMSQKEKVFSMFKRLHSHVEGTGVGMYIVKRVIENVGGKIDAESVLGIGTTFSVYFPVESPLPFAVNPE